MDLDTLARTLKLEDGRLRLDLARQAPARLWARLGPFLAGQPLILAGSPAWTTAPDRRTLTIHGEAASPPWAGMAVELELRAAADAEAFDLTLTLTATAAWWLVDAFPRLARTRFADLRLVADGEEPAAVLHLAVAADGASPAGMTLTGHARSAAFAALTGLTAAPDVVAVHGPLEVRLVTDPLQYPRGVPRDGPPVLLPDFRLGFDLPAPAGAPLRLADVRGEARVHTRYDTAYHGWALESAMIVAGDLLLGDDPPVRIPVSAAIEGDPPTRVVFGAALGDALAASLRRLSGLLGVGVASPVAGLGLDDAVDLVAVEVELACQPRLAVRRLSVAVETRETLRWALVDGLLTLDAIDLRLDVADPFTPAATLGITVSGLVGVGERGTLALAAEARRGPGGGWEPTFRGSVVRGQEPALAEVFAHFVDASPGELPDLEVHTFDFDLAPATRRFSGTLELAGSWRIAAAVPLELTTVSLGFARDGDAPATFHLGAGVRVGGLWIRVLADDEGGASGWTFAGTATGALPVGTSLATLGTQLGFEVPSLIGAIALTELGVRFNTARRDLALHAALAALPGIPGGAAAATLAIDVTLLQRANDVREATVTGLLRLQGRPFMVAFAREAGVDLLVASYAGAQGPPGAPAAPVTLRSLVADVAGSAAELIPAEFSVALERAQLAWVRGAGGEDRTLVAVELGAGFDLSRLPLVGAAVDPGRTLGIVVQLVIAAQDFSEAEVRAINRGSAPGSTRLADAALIGAPGIQVRSALRLGGQNLPIAEPLAWHDPVDSTAAPTITAAPDASTMQWFTLQRAFGPFHFERVGVGVVGDRLVVVIDASLLIAGLVLTLAGLGVEWSLAALARGEAVPDFHLDGLGLDYRQGTLEIGGALLRRPLPGQPEKDAYAGAVAVRYGELGFLGFGEYADVDGHPSVFVQALVDYPLGGPPYFQVRALAFAFGYNRALALPPIDHVATFPLVALARASEHRPAPGQLAADLARHLSPAEGEYFVAAGVAFTSFKLIEGFVLLAVRFGQRLEVDVLGLATAIAPPTDIAGGGPPLMRAELGLRACYRPDDGELRVEGRLMPDAYLFAQACHLTGGFAACAWQRTGDFVLTLGGYHPAFRPPPHYPRVPRLALRWQVDERLSLKADAYFALTPGAFMVGGHLRANWDSGDLQAWFNAGIDCLVAWQPYHYEAHAEVAIGASYRTWCHTYTVELSARLDIWGPPFSGTAHVRWWVFSFDIDFGTGRRTRDRVRWADVERAFLPAPADVLRVTAEAGAVAQPGKTTAEVGGSRGDLGAINPRHLQIGLRSAVPIKSGTALGAEVDDGKTGIGVAAMDRRDSEWHAEITVEVLRDGLPADAYFTREPLLQRLPAALWGESSKPELRGEAQVEALIGFTIRPLPIVPGSPVTTEAEPSTLVRTAPVLPDPSPARAVDGVDVRTTVQHPDTRRARAAVLQGLLPDAPCEWSGRTVEAWREAPRIVQV